MSLFCHSLECHSEIPLLFFLEEEVAWQPESIHFQSQHNPRLVQSILQIVTQYEALEREKKAAQAAEEREHRLQQAAIQIQMKYGKNAILKGMNFLEGGTTIERNGQIGGHKAE